MIHHLLDEAFRHRAVHHPYLKALADGKFENMGEVLRDFAGQYGFYSAWFPRYLTATISKLDHAEHRNHLLENLAEERGELHEAELLALKDQGIKEEWVRGIPHPQLFRRFQKAIGAEMEAVPGIEVDIWRDALLCLVQNGSQASAIGAIGLGTESVVKYIYRYIIKALENHTNLNLEEYVFFPLHTEVDDEHGLILLDIGSQLVSERPESEMELRKGMLRALNLRAAFWDDMYQRAMVISKKQVEA